MADSVSKMVTPSEIFGLHMGSAPRNSHLSSTNTGLNKLSACGDQQNPLPSHLASSTASITQVLQSTGQKEYKVSVSLDADTILTSPFKLNTDANVINVQDENLGKPSLNFEHSKLFSLNQKVTQPQEVQHAQENLSRMEPLYYILARTNSSGSNTGVNFTNSSSSISHLNVDSSSVIPLMVLNKSKQTPQVQNECNIAL